MTVNLSVTVTTNALGFAACVFIGGEKHDFTDTNRDKAVAKAVEFIGKDIERRVKA